MFREIAVQLVDQSCRPSGFASCSFLSFALVDIALSTLRGAAISAENSREPKNMALKKLVAADSLAHRAAV
jgi:hypothetical protein